ncbi:MAG TPA: VWA domain-containing protein [Candidatus Acidoferrales bacterium]|nr:VWA domain-containing protein [Candidatus Acidoferrales bacterium]
MLKKPLTSLFLFASIFVLTGSWTGAQESGAPAIHVAVDLVQLNVAVTDNKGNYVTALRPQDFVVTEDGITEEIATFGEGNESTRTLLGVRPPAGTPAVAASDQRRDSSEHVTASELSSMLGGANVFVLFDTSNYMYRGFVFAQDAIADFVRSLEGADKVAFYSYSRDLSRGALLTSDRSQVLRGVRTTVAGDDAALYDCLLLTVEDAARFTGRKVIVVFSNGPDNASVVPPEEVAELAQSTGTTIYMVSTEQAHLESISNAVFRRMTAATGGKVYFAKNWREEQDAFASIRDDLAHLYSLSYYPRANPNRGWRTITVKLVGRQDKKYHIRARDGYRLQRYRFSAGSVPPTPAASGPE